MGFGPMGGASSYGMDRESFDNSVGKDRHDNRSDRDRNNRENNYASRQEETNRREQALAKAKQIREQREKREREAKVEAARVAALEAEKKEKEKAEKEREEEAAKKALAEQTGKTDTTLAGGGVLSKLSKQDDFSEYGSIHFRQPTDEEKSLGYSDNAAFANQPSHPASKREIGDLAKETIDENSTNISAQTLGSMASVATGVPFGGELAQAGVDAYRSITTDDTDWQKQVKNEMHAEMESSGMFSNAQTAAVGVAGYSAVKNGSKVAGKVSQVLGNPITSVGIGVADKAIARESYLDKNSDYLNSLGIDLPGGQPRQPRDKNDNDSGGLLSSMVPDVPVSEPDINPIQIQEPVETPFSWVTGIDTSWRI